LRPQHRQRTFHELRIDQHFNHNTRMTAQVGLSKRR
jgi:hypothetical protein